MRVVVAMTLFAAPAVGKAVKPKVEKSVQAKTVVTFKEHQRVKLPGTPFELEVTGRFSDDAAAGSGPDTTPIGYLIFSGEWPVFYAETSTGRAFTVGDLVFRIDETKTGGLELKTLQYDENQSYSATISQYTAVHDFAALKKVTSADLEPNGDEHWAWNAIAQIVASKFHGAEEAERLNLLAKGYLAVGKPKFADQAKQQAAAIKGK